MHEIRDMVFLETGLGTNLEDVKMSHVDMDVSKNSGFPQIIHLGYLYFWKPPYNYFCLFLFLTFNEMIHHHSSAP